MGTERRRYLVMLGLHSFAAGLSGIFINVFLWRIQNSLTMLALYNLVIAGAILGSFPLCAKFGRSYSPMASLRLGILFSIAGYATVLWRQESIASHYAETAVLIGIGISLFVVGTHMQTLDCTDESNRDRFLFLSAFVTGACSILAPLLSGFVIGLFDGMTGYYVVFSVSILWFALAVLTSIRLKGKKLPTRSHFKEVWTDPTPQWKGMFWISAGMAMVEGTYSMFLVTIMTYSILKNELSLGGYNSFVAVMGTLTSVVLSKYSRPNRRLRIYTVGAAMLALSSTLLSIAPGLPALAVYALFSTIGNYLVFIVLDLWTYASIEADPDYANRRLDYIVVREIPIGVGRFVGIGLFLLLQTYLADAILPVSFALFGSVFLALTPALRAIWKPRATAT